MSNTIWPPISLNRDTNATLSGLDGGRSAGPKYLLLVQHLREAIRDGALAAGAQLPTVRDLAQQLGVTPGTVARAYQIATAEGLLTAHVGRGTFVAEPPAPVVPHPLLAERAAGFDRDSGPVDLRTPQLADVGQAAAIAQSLREAADAIGPEVVEYPGLRLDLACRQQVLRLLASYPLGPLGVDDLVLTHGGQNALGLVMQCVLRGDRPLVLAEALAYPGIRQAARLNRAEIMGVPMDDEGALPEAVEAICLRHPVRLLCLTPEAQNPTTARMGLARRQAMADLARRYDFHLLEDDCFTTPETGLPGLRALAPDRGWYCTSLSKSVSAGLRFGVMACPAGMGETGRLAAQYSFFGLSRPIIETVTRLIASGRSEALRDAAHAVVVERLKIAVDAFAGWDLRWQPGLSFMWLSMPIGWRASTFTRMAEAEGVLVRPADEYALQDGQAPNAVRIALACGISEARFRRALSVLVGLLSRPPGEMVI
ncbi:PLP-dependent aminotransferase family protein [Paracoccus sp. p4-l81]|uniref:aminotransferase-like domain-containing protein n=1 Tax=unclassified Paracoccus (in: a-proteobacteria) TaxID=2688777 RepID=UPI0035BB3C12